MQIESIEAISKDKSRIKLDSGEKFLLYKGEIRTLHLKENSDISAETYKSIVKGILPKRAKLRLLNLIKVKSYTEYQLRKKLQDSEYPEDIIDEAIEYVKSFHYIDDRAFAVDFINLHSNQHSKKEMYLKLSQKGIQKEVLDAAFTEVYGSYQDAREGESFDETSLIKKTLKKRGFTGEETYEERQKLLAYFYRRGFEMDSVYKAMDALKDGEE